MSKYIILCGEIGYLPVLEEEGGTEPRIFESYDEAKKYREQEDAFGQWLIAPLDDVESLSRKLIRDILEYAYRDIDFEYDGLTDEEKDFMTKDEFQHLMWVLSLK